MHLLVFPGSPLLSRRPGRVLLQTAWKAHASPAIRSQLLPSGVSYSPLFSLTPHPHPRQGMGWGQGTGHLPSPSPARVPCQPQLCPDAPLPPCNTERCFKCSGTRESRHILRGQIATEITPVNPLEQRPGAASTHQHAPVHRDSDGGSRGGSELERLTPAKSKNSNTVPARAICRSCTIYTSETQAPVH